MIGKKVLVAFFQMVLVAAVIATAVGGNTGTALAANEISKLVLSKNSLSMETGDTSALTATALYTNGSSEDVTIKTDWVSSKDSVASVYAGNVTAKGEGTATLTATYMNTTVIVNVTVVKKVRALSKDKQSIDIRKGASDQVTLTAVFTDGSTDDVTAKAEWTVDQYSVATVLNGKIVGQGAGTATVTAKYGSQSVTIPVSVEVIRRLDPGKNSLSLPLNGSEPITLLATFADGTVEDVAKIAEWSSDNGSIADAIKGEIKSYGTGTATITAKYGTKTATIKVESGISRRLDVDKTSLFMKVNDVTQLKLTSTNADEKPEDVTDKAVWTSGNETVAYVSKGKVTAYASGEATITATYGTKTVTILVDVDVPRKLGADKTTVAVQPGDTNKLVLTAYYQDGREEDITEKAQWSSASTAVAEVRQGVVTGIATGSTTVTATYGKRFLTIPVSVGVIKSLTADQTKLILSKGKTAKVALTVEYADGLKKDVTTLATWASAQEAVATVTDGAVTAVAAGKTTITATYEGKTVSIPIEIDQAQSLSASVTTIVMGTGESKQVTLTATTADGTAKNVTDDAEWITSNAAAADVAKGLVRGLTNGRAVVTAKYGGQSVTITVEVGIVTKMDTDKHYITLKTGNTVQVNLIATLSDGSTKNVTKDAEWKTTSYKIADVQDGLVTAVGYGKTTITVRYSGKTISIPVEVDTLKYLKTSAVKLEMKPGQTTKVTATATYMDGTDTNVTVAGLWASSKILVADVKDGIITAYGPGQATITVNFAGKKTAVVVVVKP
ncbi:Ig-like domain-containing protein [Brevibacillus fluminis]|uniref:Ig-like domain-containing protein n=1 Tax=Brevibacillus fluminis TaxID=511487 RepID=UPI003F8954DA